MKSIEHARNDVTGLKGLGVGTIVITVDGITCEFNTYKYEIVNIEEKTNVKGKKYYLGSLIILNTIVGTAFCQEINLKDNTTADKFSITFKRQSEIEMVGCERVWAIVKGTTGTFYKDIQTKQSNNQEQLPAYMQEQPPVNNYY